MSGLATGSQPLDGLSGRPTAIIPVFNEELGILGKVIITKKHFAKVVVVDDGSFDATAENAAFAGAEVVRCHRNRGIDLAIHAGIQFASKEGYPSIVVVSNWDSSNFRDLHSLLAPLHDKKHPADVVWFSKLAAPALVRHTSSKDAEVDDLLFETLPDIFALTHRAVAALASEVPVGPKGLTGLLRTKVRENGLRLAPVRGPFWKGLETGPMVRHQHAPDGLLGLLTVRRPLLIWGGLGLAALGGAALLALGPFLESQALFSGMAIAVLALAGVISIALALVLHAMGRLMT